MHVLLEVDEATRTGVCAVCGPTKVRRKTRRNGRKWWRCATHAKRFDNHHERKKGPYRHLLGDRCERCGFVPEDDCQLDVHHAAEGVETLCANCHRLVSKLERG